jgi:hypothetical protein
LLTISQIWHTNSGVKSYQTTLGGALGALGKALMGVGIVPQLAGTPSKFLLYVAVAGFLLDALGSFFTALFAADQSQVIKMLAMMNRGGIDTGHLTKQDVDNAAAIAQQNAAATPVK